MRIHTISLFVGWLIIGFVGVGPAFWQSANTLITQETKESWTLLFDGTSTAG